MTSPACPNVINMLALLACCVVAGVAHAAEPAYPTRPVRVVVGFPPGGGTDVMARLLAPKLSASMGQTWVVDNRTGAGGNLAVETVAHANPDGHTALLALDTQVTANPQLYKLAINVEKDLQPITLLSSTDMMLIVHPSVPAKTLKEFVALAKQKPGTLNFASAGTGSVVHLTSELLKKRAGFDMVHVPYKGGGPAATAVIAGEAQVLLGTVASSLPYIKAGRLRALANTAGKRSKWMPDLPTVAESGYPGFDSGIWYALLVTGATPKSIAERIRSEVLKALQHADVQAAMDRQGLVLATSTPDELAARIKRETSTWAGIIKDAHIRAQ